MTRRALGRVVLGVWLGCLTAGAAQLPPEIMVDRYLLRAERLMEAQDPKGALELMGKIVALQEEHGLTFPREFHFKHAQMALLAGAVQEAIDAVSMYLVEAGREGKSYREALELLEEAELLQRWFDPQQTCTGKSKGAECWMEVVGQPGCYVWNRSLEPDATVTWTGACSGGRAQGEGTLKWVWEDGEKSAELTGSLTDGRMHGQWVERFWSGIVAEGPYVDGKEHGQWVLRFANGNVWEGPYVEGKKHGHWVGRGADGTVFQEGPFADGKRHGDWIERDEDGWVLKGPYEEGEKHGHWVKLFADGTVREEGPYAEGQRHGQWVIRSGDGTVSAKGPYVEGAKQGHWIFLRNDGAVNAEGHYVAGERHGHWREYSFESKMGGYVYNEGPYVKGERHGKWLIRDSILRSPKKIRVAEVIYRNGDSVRTEREWTERRRKRK